MNESIERFGALFQAALQPLPFGLCQHARNEIERDQAFGIATFRINRKGDADAAEQDFGLAALHRLRFRGQGLQPGIDQRIGCSDFARPSQFVEHRLACCH